MSSDGVSYIGYVECAKAFADRYRIPCYSNPELGFACDPYEAELFHRWNREWQAMQTPPKNEDK